MSETKEQLIKPTKSKPPKEPIVRGLTPEKSAIIKKVYYDTGGFGSMAKTLTDAKKEAGGNNIRLEDVQAWFNKNLSQKTKITGYNSYVAQGPKEEYQADFFH